MKTKVNSEQAQVKRYFIKADRGLDHQWLGIVFMNPPFSRRLTDKLINKLLLVTRKSQRQG
jgi:hypothetical protein